MKSVVLLFIVIAPSVFCQIPNSGFENWLTISGYQVPADWDNLNQMTSSENIFTCMKGMPGYQGNNYLFLMSKTLTGKGVVPGRVVSGKIDTVNYKPMYGYPYTSRPQSLTYSLQYMPYDPSDSSSVKVLFTKWNQSLGKRDTIGLGETYYNAMAHNWFTSSTYINYVSGDAPDSAIVEISSSSRNPKNGSYIYIDNLQFEGNVIGVSQLTNPLDKMSIYPNPFKNFIKIDAENSANSDLILAKVFDITGKNIFSLTLNKNDNVINTSNWIKGIYFINFKQNEHSINKKIIKE